MAIFIYNYLLTNSISHKINAYVYLLLIAIRLTFNDIFRIATDFSRSIKKIFTSEKLKYVQPYVAGNKNEWR